MALAALIFICLIALALLDLATRRIAERLARFPQSDRCAGTAFDTSSVRPRICSVRSDHISELQARASDSDYHHELIADARHTIAKLPFFASRQQIMLEAAG